MTADGTKPTPYKRYYDLFTWLVTQLAFSFTTTPFILLTIHDSALVWARVYFYAIVGVLACSGFLASPGKAWLTRKVKARTSEERPAMQRQESTESLAMMMNGPVMGVPSEPGREWDERVDEVVGEVKKRRGSKAGPEGRELRRLVEDMLVKTTTDGEGRKVK